MARKYDIPFLEVSAKNAVCVDETFTTMATEIQARFIKEKGNKTKENNRTFEFGRGASPVALNKVSVEKEPESSKKNCC